VTAPRSVAVLGYHKIGEPPIGGWQTWNYVSEESFEQHLEVLVKSGRTVLDLATFLRGLEAPDQLPERSALLTFDDGVASMLTVATPILGRFGMPAVLFVPTDHIGGRNVFDQGAEPDERLCTADELRELHRWSVAIQSHAASHRTFSDLDLAQQQDEVSRSQDLLQELIGAPVEALAFPFGDLGKQTIRLEPYLRERGYRAAFGYGGGALTLPGAHPLRLARIPVGADTRLDRELWRTQG
jgi:peptidoglycan/xylan/chitin deacetylase (PgdA/CDA1 family)